MNLPGLIPEKFTDVYISKKRVPGLSEWKIFSNFMEDQIEASRQHVSDMTEQKVGAKLTQAKPSSVKRQSDPKDQSTKVLNTVRVVPKGKCPVCSQESHPTGPSSSRFSKKPCYQLWLCKKFVGMPVDQRAEVAAKNEICVRCTSWIHKTTDCKSTWKCRTMLGSTTCDSSKHHELFHGSNNAYVNVVHKFNLMKVDEPITELDLA